MKKHTRLTTQAFNKAGSTYDHHASAQAAAGHALIQHIAAISRVYHSVLDAGCGTGVTTAALANTIQYQSFTAVDTAAGMLQQTSCLPHDIHCMEFDFNDILSLSQYYNLIFSNMSLHWSHSFAHTLNIFSQTLAPGGILAFTMPLHGTFKELPEHVSINCFHSRDEIEKLIQQSGLQTLHSSELTYCQQFSDSLSALRSIKLTGATHVKQRRHNSLRGKSFLNSMSFRQLSYVTGFFLGMKPHA